MKVFRTWLVVPCTALMVSAFSCGASDPTGAAALTASSTVAEILNATFQYNSYKTIYAGTISGMFCDPDNISSVDNCSDDQWETLTEQLSEADGLYSMQNADVQFEEMGYEGGAIGDQGCYSDFAITVSAVDGFDESERQAFDYVVVGDECGLFDGFEEGFWASYHISDSNVGSIDEGGFVDWVGYYVYAFDENGDEDPASVPGNGDFAHGTNDVPDPFTGTAWRLEDCASDNALTPENPGVPLGVPDDGTFTTLCESSCAWEYLAPTDFANEQIWEVVDGSDCSQSL